MSLITVGPRNARTDPDTGLRFYTWDGVEYPSVTTVRNLTGMPHKLANWRTNQVIEKAMTDYGTLGTMLASGTKPEAVASWLRQAVNYKRDLAANLGTRVHRAAAEGVTLDKAEPDVAPFLMHYQKFLDHSGIEILLAEQQVWNLTVGYAGSFDLIGRFKRTQKTFLIDIKTGGNVYPEHVLQLEAYARGEFVGADNKVDKKATSILQQVDGRAILHLRPEHWTFSTIRPETFGSTWEAFVDLLNYAMWAYSTPEVDRLVEKTISSIK